MVIKINFNKYNILAIAVMLSLIWHLFWISAIKVVVMPNRTEPVRFSKVSFLGPILTKVTMDVRAEPRKQSFLEKRYLDCVDNSVWPEKIVPDSARLKFDNDKTLRIIEESRMTGLIDEVLGAAKMTPSYSAEE